LKPTRKSHKHCYQRHVFTRKVSPSHGEPLKNSMSNLDRFNHFLFRGRGLSKPRPARRRNLNPPKSRGHFPFFLFLGFFSGGNDTMHGIRYHSIDL
jgi:hypothetical protein